VFRIYLVVGSYVRGHGVSSDSYTILSVLVILIMVSLCFLANVTISTVIVQSICGAYNHPHIPFDI
jgi:hypothetical protein